MVYGYRGSKGFVPMSAAQLARRTAAQLPACVRKRRVRGQRGHWRMS